MNLLALVAGLAALSHVIEVPHASHAWAAAGRLPGPREQPPAMAVAQPEDEPQPAVELMTRQVPAPQLSRTTSETIAVAIGLSPEAPGSRAEQAILQNLERSLLQSSDPKVKLRRLRPGVGDPRQVCRAKREDLVIMVGYLPDREAPVLLAQDCRLDRGLGVRGPDAATQPSLVAALWQEHRDLQAQGLKERRRPVLGPKAKAGIIAGVAVVVIGIALGVLLAATLRKDKVVITVSP